MKIQVIGSGCTTCKNLYELTQKAVEQAALEAEVEYVTDISKLIEMGVMTSPALVVDEKVVMTGFVNDVGRIIELIKGE